MEKTVTMNLRVSNYASRVLGVIKERFGLRDKAAALEKFTELFGEDFIEREPKETYIKKLIELEKKHFEKHSNRKMSLRELDKLTK